MDQNAKLYINLNQGESGQHLCFEATKILNKWLEELLNTYDAIPEDSFLNDEAGLLQQLFEFTERFSQGSNLHMRAAFERLAEQFMVVNRQLNVQQMHWLNNLVVSIERACSPLKALEFADKFNA
jgi:hypothetical protein